MSWTDKKVQLLRTLCRELLVICTFIIVILLIFCFVVADEKNKKSKDYHEPPNESSKFVSSPGIKSKENDLTRFPKLVEKPI
jgi:hypothetical protein